MFLCNGNEYATKNDGRFTHALRYLDPRRLLGIRTEHKDTNPKKAGRRIHAGGDRRSTYVISEPVRAANMQMNAAARASGDQRTPAHYICSHVKGKHAHKKNLPAAFTHAGIDK